MAGGNDYYPLASEETLKEIANGVNKNDPNIIYQSYDLTIGAGSQSIIAFGSGIPTGASGWLTNLKAKITVDGVEDNERKHLFAWISKSNGQGVNDRLDDARIDFLDATSTSINPGIFGNSSCILACENAKITDSPTEQRRPKLFVKNNGGKTVRVHICMSASKRYVVIP